MRSLQSPRPGSRRGWGRHKPSPSSFSFDGGETGTFRAGTTLTFTAVNGFGTGDARASSYKYLWDTNAADPTDWSGASSWTSDPLVVTGLEGTYYIHLLALNGDGAANPVSWISGAYTFVVPEPSAILASLSMLMSLLGLRRRGASALALRAFRHRLCPLQQSGPTDLAALPSPLTLRSAVACPSSRRVGQSRMHPTALCRDSSGRESDRTCS